MDRSEGGGEVYWALRRVGGGKGGVENGVVALKPTKPEVADEGADEGVDEDNRPKEEE